RPRPRRGIPVMALVYPYQLRPLRAPAYSLRGRTNRPKPLIDISVVGPRDTRLMQALLDTGADDTVFHESLAARIGVDLTNATEGEGGSFGGVTIARLRFAPVPLRLATASERREWVAIVGFTSVPLRWALLGFAGVLEYFTATFRGDREEVELTVNSLYPGT